MSDLDYDALDEAVMSVMQDDDADAPGEAVDPIPSDPPAPKAKPSKASAPKTPPRPRGRYLDMIHPNSDMRKDKPSTPRPSFTAQQPPDSFSDRIYSEPEDPTEEERRREEYIASLSEPNVRKTTPATSQVLSKETTIRETFEFGVIEDVQRDSATNPDPFDAPDANNFSLGGKSPFIKDAVIEKRPLGASPAAHSANSVKSTKNVYSSREAVKHEPLDTSPTMVVDSPRQKSGWLSVLVIFLVIILGAALGAAIYFLFLQ